MTIGKLRKYLAKFPNEAEALIFQSGVYYEVTEITLGTGKEIPDDEWRPGELKDWEFVAASIGSIVGGCQAVLIT